MHAAQQVIEAIKARLVAGPTDAGARVYTDRDFPLGTEQLPAWLVYALDEPIEPDTVHWPQQRRHTLLVALRACAQRTSADGIDTVLHRMRLQAEQCLFDTLEHATLAPLAVPLQLKRARPEFGQRLDVQTGEIELQIEAPFSTLANAPEAFA